MSLLEGISAVRWVNNKSFVGLDRRRARPKLKFGERRQEAGAADAPSLASALRQLRVLAAGANRRSGVLTFIDRAKAIAELAEAYGEAYLAEELRRLATLMGEAPATDWAARLESTLSTIAERYEAAAVTR